MSKNKNINNNDIECLNIGTVRKTSKNVILSCIYRPPRGDVHIFLDEMKGHIIKNKFQENVLFLVGNLSMNFLILFFRSKSSATVIDHILKNIFSKWFNKN